MGISEGSVAGPGGVEGGTGGGGEGGGGGGEDRKEEKKEENGEVVGSKKGPGGGAEPGHQCFIGMVVSRNLLSFNFMIYSKPYIAVEKEATMSWKR